MSGSWAGLFIEAATAVFDGQPHREKSMKLIAILAACTVLAGCAGSGKLIRAGQVYPLEYNSLAQTITTTVDGETYTGTYIINRGMGTATGLVGTKLITTTVTTSGNQGRALLTSPSGKVLRCEFLVDGLKALGQCQDAQGAIYDLTAG